MSTPEQRQAARSQELVQAALEVFADRGYHPAGVADIVKRAGVSHGTFYNYFDNKRHILDAVLDYGVQRLVDEVVGEDRPGAAGTAAEFAAQFRAMMDRLFDVIERDSALVEFVLLEAPAVDSAVVDRLLGLFGTLAALTDEYLSAGIERGYLSPEIDPGVAAEALLSLTFSGVLLAARGPVGRADRERHLDAISDLAVGGVLA